MRLYASFLNEILNDKEGGNELLMRAKDAALVKANIDCTNLHDDMTDINNYAPDGTPCLYISGDSEKIGTVLQINMSACRVFGYSKKEEVMGNNVTMLMPDLYGECHNEFVIQAA